MFEGYKRMHIDEDKTLLRISDHNLVKDWFKIGLSSKPRWMKTKPKIITVVKKMKNPLPNAWKL